jgi:hypothetical protein
VFDYQCPGCGVRGVVDSPKRGGELCGLCAARVTWESLSPDTQRAIDTAINRGAISGLLAMRETTPTIRLPHAMDVLQFRYNSGVAAKTAHP